MNARPAHARRPSATLALAALLGLTLSACSSTVYEVVIQAPVSAKLDISKYQRIYVAGFVASPNDDLDASMETVRLLRNQLRNKNVLRVLDADAVPLAEKAQELAGPDAGPIPVAQTEADLDPYAKVFSDTEYWKSVGAELESPLILTGTVVFLPQERSGFVQREQESYDQFGRRQVVPVRTYMERKGFVLRPTFVFIDGATGEQVYSESFREEVLYNSNQQTPALSSYFELMDRLIPSVLNTLTAQKVRGNRVLLK